MICLPSNISEKIHWQHLFENLRESRLIAFIFANTIQHPRILKNNMTIQAKGEHYHFFVHIPSLYLTKFWSILSTKNHVLVVTIEIIWLLFLNVLSFKSLRFRRFVVVPTTVKVILLFLRHVRCWKWPRSFFCSCLSPMIVHLGNLFLLSTPVARMLLTPRWLSRRRHVK